MDVKNVLYRFAFTIYSAIGREFSENAVYSPYSAFISTIISAIISPNDEIYSRFLQYIGITENLTPAEIISEVQNIIQESETIPVTSLYFLNLLNLIFKKENAKDLAFNYMKKSEQCLMYSHIKKKIINFFPEISFNSEDALFLHFSDFFNIHKTDKRIERFLKSIEVPISQLRKAPTIICPNIIYVNSKSINPKLQGKLSEICEDLRFEFKSCTFPQPAIDQINHSIATSTDETITRIVSEETIEKDTKILNVNSILFDAKWEKFFAAVESRDFHLYSGEKRQIKTMLLRHKKCPYFENDDIQVLQLNYACSQYSMVYILNKNAQSVQISNKELLKALESLVETDVYIEIPRFEAEFGPASIDSCFPPDLKKDANANFLKIIQKVRLGNYEEGTAPTPPGERKIDRKRKLEKNEKGSEVTDKGKSEQKHVEEEEKKEDCAVTQNDGDDGKLTFLTENKDVKNCDSLVESTNDQKSDNNEVTSETVSGGFGAGEVKEADQKVESGQTAIPTVESLNGESKSIDHLSIENNNKSSLSQSITEEHPKVTTSGPSNRINTATSPTTSSADIHFTSPTESTILAEEEEEPDEEEDDFDCDRNGATSEFLCNHPFLFFVINRHNRVILFMGTITDPISVDLQPLTIDQRADNFLASIRGDSLPFPASSSIEDGDVTNNGGEVIDSKSIWDEIDQIGISPSQPSNEPSAKPLTPKAGDGQISPEKEKGDDDEKLALEAQMDHELMEYVYEGKPKPKPDIKQINRMFGYESKKKKTFSSFSPWSGVVFYKAKSALNHYKPLDKPKYPRGPHLPPLPPLSDLSSTNWEELEKELEEYGKPVMHSSAAKKSTPKLVEPIPNAILSLRGARMKKH